MLKSNTLEIVVARYNEDIEWFKPLEKFVTVYNKGEKLDIPNEKIIPNFGRESETYLRHIIENYDSLKDTTVFTQAKISDHMGSNNLEYLVRMVRIAEEKKMSLPSSIFFCEDIEEYPPGSTPEMKNCVSIEITNHDIQSTKLKISKNFEIITDVTQNMIVYSSGPTSLHFPWSPEWNFVDNKYYLEDNYKDGKHILFKKWFEENINEHYPNPIKIHSAGLFAVKKELILKHPKEYYENLIKLVNYHVNPIEGHFFERSWYYIFS